VLILCFNKSTVILAFYFFLDDLFLILRAALMSIAAENMQGAVSPTSSKGPGMSTGLMI
jgi:hypothetical protein